MASPGEKVRILLNQRNMSIADLASNASLSDAQVKNIIYNRSKKPEFFYRIAKALNVTYEYLTESRKSYQISLENYQNSSEIVISILKENKVSSLDSSMLENFIEKTYKHLSEGKSYESSSQYIRGVIETNLETGTLKREIDA